MISLLAKIRRKNFKRNKDINILPAILYGPKIENLPLEINLKEFQKIHKEAGESTLILLDVQNKAKFSVLIHVINYDPITGKPIHVDFYQPSLEKEVEVLVPIIFEGESLAVKNLEGTLIKNISEIQIKALPQKLPKEITVDISKLETFDDYILVEDLKIPEDVKILKDPKEIIAFVSVPEKVTEELEKPIEEKIEEIELVEKKKKEETIE